jgi:hypothetical protein
MDYSMKMQSFKVRNGLKYLQPIHVKELFGKDPKKLAEARRVWRMDNRLCNPTRKQFKN